MKSKVVRQGHIELQLLTKNLTSYADNPAIYQLEDCMEKVAQLPNLRRVEFETKTPVLIEDLELLLASNSLRLVELDEAMILPSEELSFQARLNPSFKVKHTKQHWLYNRRSDGQLGPLDINLAKYRLARWRNEPDTPPLYVYDKDYWRDKLDTIDLSGIELNAQRIEKLLPALPEIRTLLVTDRNNHEMVIELINKCSKLDSLYLFGTYLSTEDAKQISRSSKLDYIEHRGAPFLPEAIISLKHIKNLDGVYYFGCPKITQSVMIALDELRAYLKTPNAS